ncbi:MAG: TonB-dependent receptor [Salinivirgaceae bacterium]|nr:TonB-dependent receptor [Salinivirgaceae bacterium]
MLGILYSIREKRKLIGLLVLVFLSWSNLILADNIPDTVHIDEIVISSENINRFQTGAKIVEIDAKQLELLQDGNLEQLLSRTTPIAFKTMSGSLSTIRVRGTSPNHTSVNFGGLNINSLTLGHSNVSNIPMYLFDKIGLQYGSSSAVNGSGSIGGAVHLGLTNYWVDGFKAEVRSAFGSTGEQLYGTKLFFGNGKWETVTRAYYYYNKNEFSFLNSSTGNVENGKKIFEDVQKSANIENKGLLQEFNYKFAKNETFKLMAWVEDDWHLIQQNMATNWDNPDMRESLKDDNIRLWSTYNNRKHLFKYHIGAGYVFDNSVYNNTNEKIKTQRAVGDAYVEHDIKPYLSYKIGLKATKVKTDVYSYNGSLDEERLDMFLQFRYKLFNKLESTFNLRQGFVSDYSVPFTPTLGLSYILTSKEKIHIKVTGNIAKNYRVPTFNDRFWGTQGNPDLFPEDGMNYELGSKMSFWDSKISGNLSLSTFYIDVENWLLWVPGTNDWYPENAQRVISKGFEWQGSIKNDVGWGSVNSGFVYAYTSTQRIKPKNFIDKENDPSSNAFGRQLEYVPLHSCKIYSSLDFKKWSAGFDGQMVPWQYTNKEEDDILDGYFMLNFNIQREIEIDSKHKLQIRALINNILNVNYQSSYGYAMPRLNFKLSITYNFN